MNLGNRLQVGREVARRTRAWPMGSGLGRTILHSPGEYLAKSGPDRAQVPATALFLLGAIAAAVVLQGGFFARGKIAAAALLAAALITMLPVHAARCPELRFPLIAGGLLTGWMLIRATFSGSLGASAPEALLLVEMATVVVLCRRLDRAAQRLLLTGLLGVGVFVAMVGWAGVVWRAAPWGLTTQGLWRAASTLTYANATAAFLVPLALVASAGLTERPRSLRLGLTVTALLIGAAATFSRAGALALGIGLVLTTLLLGRVVLVAVLKPFTGAVVALVGLLPSVPVAGLQRPILAVAALVGGMAVTAILQRYLRPGGVAGIAALLLGVGLAVGLIAGSDSVRAAAVRVWNVRGNLASDRTTAAAPALRVVAKHPITGIGPGRAVLRWTDESGRLRVEQYVHDEYLQVLTELGLIGLVLLLTLLAGTARLLLRSRAQVGAWPALTVGVAAACAAAAVQAGFDFVWHVPAVPLILAVLIGLVVPRATSSGEVA